MMLNSVLVNTIYYERLSNLNIISSKNLNKIIGIRYFKWVVKNTFFQFFNQKIKIENKNVDLFEIRNEMTTAEISHLIGFTFVTLFAIYKSYKINLVFGLIIMIANVFLNLYPSLLQQENKRRISKLIRRQTKTKGNSL